MGFVGWFGAGDRWNFFRERERAPVLSRRALLSVPVNFVRVSCVC